MFVDRIVFLYRVVLVEQPRSLLSHVVGSPPASDDSFECGISAWSITEPRTRQGLIVVSKEFKFLGSIIFYAL